MKRECFYMANIQTFRSVSISWIFNVALMKIINYCSTLLFRLLVMERCWLSKKKEAIPKAIWNEKFQCRRILMSAIFKRRDFKIIQFLGGNEGMIRWWCYRHWGFKKVWSNMLVIHENLASVAGHVNFILVVLFSFRRQLVSYFSLEVNTKMSSRSRLRTTSNVSMFIHTLITLIASNN